MPASSPPVSVAALAQVAASAPAADSAKLDAEISRLQTMLPANYSSYPLSGSQRYGQLATNCRVLNAKSASNTGFTARSHHVARGAITELAVKIPNWYVERAVSKLETPNNGTALYGASIEYPAGTYYRLKFNGGARINVGPGGDAITDFLTISIPDGDEFWVNVWQSAGTTITFFNGGTGQVAANNEKNITSATDYSMGGGALATQTFGWWALAIIGRTTNTAVGIYGDSIGEGVGDTVDSTDHVGIVARAVGGTCAYINLSQSGDRLEYANDSSNKRLAQLAYVKNAVCEMGVNDIGSGRTLAQIKAGMITAWNAAGAKLPTGGRVFQTTITPSTTSTDSWATTANQTAATNFSTAGNGTRELLNDWLRDGAPMSGGAAAAIGEVGALRAGDSGHPIHSVFEVADQVESARNSGKWKVDGTANKWTADGIHPTQFAYQQVASSGAINTALFA